MSSAVTVSSNVVVPFVRKSESTSAQTLKEIRSNQGSAVAQLGSYGQSAQLQYANGIEQQATYGQSVTPAEIEKIHSIFFGSKERLDALQSGGWIAGADSHQPITIHLDKTHGSFEELKGQEPGVWYFLRPNLDDHDFQMVRPGTVSLMKGDAYQVNSLTPDHIVDSAAMLALLEARLQPAPVALSEIHGG